MDFFGSDPGFVSRITSRPGFVNPVRVLSIRSDPIRFFWIRPRDYFGRNLWIFLDPIRVLSVGSHPVQVLSIRSNPARVLSIRSDPIHSGPIQVLLTSKQMFVRKVSLYQDKQKHQKGGLVHCKSGKFQPQQCRTTNSSINSLSF